eukprot:22338-Chlamydomonas_euryale.AAC.2
MDLSGETETVSNSSMPMAKRQAHSRPALQLFICTAGQQAFNKHLDRFLYRNNVALHVMEDHALQSAAATVGVTTPTRRVLSGPMWDTEFNLCKADANKLVDDSEFYALASDGYQRKIIESGVPLVDFVLVLPS